MSREVIITTGSRLHWGLLSLSPQVGREFGGIGLMIQEPQLKLSVTQSTGSTDTVKGSPGSITKIREALAAVRNECPQLYRDQFYDLVLHSEIPQHCGFGSGTQLSLAVAQALASMAEEPSLTSVELAQRVQRGARSALGIHGFTAGGFLVEGGKQSTDEISPLVVRADFPEDWQILLVTPTNRTGISGYIEADAIQQLGAMPLATTEKLCRLALMQLAPAVQTHDFEEFASGLTEFGHVVGEFFRPAQGGIFADPQMAELEKKLRSRGIRGIAQTSWGPTLSIICQDVEMVASLVRECGYGEFCELRTARPLNEGAQIQINQI
ncbi:beta-ribofuranosylaminobenzene 5'-phosphate synthase family protein [Gimesia algae]|uniref:GHMP kinase N-terminal domain-containing protein n=1 Tax=Gimesia algae TaxID=2527971 RepID=A0A517VCN5_9PLAN|nr:beta-ribofuranosylaminobenzene 5'-phosphate synthase family protein [Gimesia algae]QDT90753.1 hypothetical protein Pan161_24060 [Gimesia algae]